MTVADLIRVLQTYDPSLPVDTVGAAVTSYAWVEPLTIGDITLRHGGTRLGLLGNSRMVGWGDESDGDVTASEAEVPDGEPQPAVAIAAQAEDLWDGHIDENSP